MMQFRKQKDTLVQTEISKIAFYLVGIFCSQLGIAQAQNFPKLGNDTLLDIACWNVEWFGSTSYGPTDETTQYNNVLAFLNKTELDVIALEEISNPSTYNTLSLALGSKYDTYISDYSQTQKTGIYWRKSMFSVVAANTYNLSLNSSDNYAFASRPPLQVCLKTEGGTKTDTIYFLVLHMKAQTESTDAGRFESYTRRQNAANALKLYLETTLTGKKYVVLGDWNDDLDASIYNALETPYKGLLNANYTFPSNELTIGGKASYAFGSNMIDHLMNSKTLDSFYYKNSAKVLDNADSYCSGFSNNTSDHFPVYANYNWKKLTTKTPSQGLLKIESIMDIKIYPSPASSMLTVNCDKQISSLEMYNSIGQLMPIRSEPTHQIEIDLTSFARGMYYLKLEIHGCIETRLIVLQ
ncbi:MAG: T9SS type A sorting domain-containing protein [bacterium]|nr:T9SS type A sorting domain-containing protein [bacterium]